MKAIGGYFELETLRRGEYHKDAIKLNTGRNCLEYVLRARKYKKVYIPYYTCEVILEPLQKTGAEYVFYGIDSNLELSQHVELHEGEALLYTNYYGLKQNYVAHLSSVYGKRLIVDNTQAFFAPPLTGIDTFYTCRKFFGVPDGAYLYTDATVDIQLEQDVSYERISSLVKRIDLGPEAGYGDFREASHQLIGQPMKRMSRLTECLMQSVGYEESAGRRRANYQHLHEGLAETNLLHLNLERESVPMVYPYHAVNGPALRERLIANRVFVARYWPNVLEWAAEGSVEHGLVADLLPLPVDQRYGQTEMDTILGLLRAS